MQFHAERQEECLGSLLKLILKIPSKSLIFLMPSVEQLNAQRQKGDRTELDRDRT